MHPCVIRVNANRGVTGDPPRNLHYFHMFPREDIQRGLCHCAVEDGTAVIGLAAQTCCSFVWRAFDGME